MLPTNFQAVRVNFLITFSSVSHAPSAPWMLFSGDSVSAFVVFRTPPRCLDSKNE
jgi:hypothetical protein